MKYFNGITRSYYEYLGPSPQLIKERDYLIFVGPYYCIYKNSPNFFNDSEFFSVALWQHHIQTGHLKGQHLL